jgi:arylsulfatase A-like enzyme
MVLNEGCSPLIIRWPAGIKGGRVNDSIVSNLDFAPTLLEAIGSPVPAGMDGVSLWPILRDEKRSVRDSAYLEITYTRGIVTKDWKYIATRFPKEINDQITLENRRTFNQEGSHASSGDPNRAFVRYSSEKRYPGYFADDQLYNLRVDPREQNNLADDPACAAVLAEMKALLSTACQDLPHSFGEFKQIK